MFTVTGYSLPKWRYHACTFMLFLTLTRAHAYEPQPNTVLRADSAFVVPLTYDPFTNQVPTVRVRINRSAPLVFIVDTGSNFPVLIDEWAARKLKLNPFGPSGPGTSAGGLNKPSLAPIRSFEFVGSGSDNSVAVSVEKAGIIDLGLNNDVVEGPRIAGVIGTPVLAAFVVQLDFAALTMTLSPSRNTIVPQAGSARLTMTESAGHYFVRVGFGRTTDVTMELDTAARLSEIPWSAAAALSPTATAEYGAVGNAGSQTYRALLLSTVRIGDLVEPTAVVYANRSPNTVGLLGMDLLRRFRITLDIGNNRLTLVRAANYTVQVRRLPATPCVYLAQQEGKYFVEHVDFGSAAEMAGVRKGDRLLSVDGRSLTGMHDTPAQLIVTGFTGEEARLELARSNGQRLQVTYERPSLFQAHPREGFGFSANPNGDGRLFITGVTPSSPAQDAGLRVGDEIVEINQKAAVTMTVKEIAAAAANPGGGEIVLKVLRKGEDKPQEVKLAKRVLP